MKPWKETCPASPPWFPNTRMHCEGMWTLNGDAHRSCHGISIAVTLRIQATRHGSGSHPCRCHANQRIT